MIGAILGAALQVGSSIIGGISAAKQRRKQREAIEKAGRENDAWYTREKYADPTMRASARYMLNKSFEAARDRVRAAKGRGAIMGNADAQIAAAQEANAQGAADAVGKVAAMNDARIDRIEDRYQANKQDLLNKQLSYDGQTANHIADAVKAAGGVAQAVFGNNAGGDGSGDMSTGSKHNLGASSNPTNLGASDSEAATEAYLRQTAKANMLKAAGINV